MYHSQYKFYFLKIFIIKLVFFLFFSNFFEHISHDSWEYLSLGKSIFKDFSYSINNEIQMNRAPGYPLFISIVNILSEKVLLIILFQIILDVFLILMVINIWEKINRTNISFFYLFLFSSCIYTNFYSNLIMTEFLYSFLIILSLWLFVFKFKKSNIFFDIGYNQILFCSLLLSWLVLVRQPAIFSIFLFLLLFLILIILKDIKNFKVYFFRGIIFLIIFLIPLSIWSLRNYINFKHEILNNPNATILGYKTNLPNYNHFFDKDFKKYVQSYVEPFVLIRPFEKPKIARYIYLNEEIEVEQAFNELEKDLIQDKLKKPRKSTLHLFKIITEKRYAEDENLYLKASLSRLFKLVFSPRIGSLLQEGDVTKIIFDNKKVFYFFIFYNFIYIFLFILGIIFNKKNSKIKLFVFIFGISFILGHLLFYSFYSPYAQSRYLIPIFPILFIFFPKNFFLKVSRN